jgi:hypothetical protein
MSHYFYSLPYPTRIVSMKIKKIKYVTFLLCRNDILNDEKYKNPYLKK